MPKKQKQASESLMILSVCFPIIGLILILWQWLHDKNKAVAMKYGWCTIGGLILNLILISLVRK